MEEKISKSIIRSFFNKLEDSLSLDAAVVGAGPSGMIAGKELALAGKKVAIFESKLAPGGGMLFTKSLYPGLYASGMAANNAMGGFRMGPIFGGMFLSGKKAAQLILENID